MNPLLDPPQDEEPPVEEPVCDHCGGDCDGHYEAHHADLQRDDDQMRDAGRSHLLGGGDR